MAAPTNYYVDPDPAVGVDFATGGTTPADPYRSVQFAVDDIQTSHGGRDAVNGDQVNVVEGTDDTPAATLDLATVGAVYGVPAADAPLNIRGCARDPITGLPVAGNGGVGGITGGAGGFAIYDGLAGATDHVNFIDMHCHNVGAADVLYIRDHGTVAGCEIHGSTGGRALRCRTFCRAFNNHIYDNAVSAALEFNGICYAYGNYITTPSVASCIRLGGTDNVVARNILIPTAAATIGIDISAPRQMIDGNSIMHDGGTNQGIRFDANNHYGVTIINNLIEGFSAGGSGIAFGASVVHVPVYANNSFHDNFADESNLGDFDYEADNDLGMAASPFMKGVAPTFANRFIYFKPAIPVRGRAFPDGCRFDRGAVQVRLAVERDIPATVVTTIPARTVLDPLE